jgi:ribosomal protein L11
MVREKESSFNAGASLTFIRLLLPAGEATSAPPLSAILGQVQVNSSDFCKQFNQVSLSSFEAGTLLNVHLFKNPDGTFFFKIRGIFLPFLLFQASEEAKHIPVEYLFDIFTMVQSSESPSNYFYCAKSFFGSLRAMGFKVIF